MLDFLSLNFLTVSATRSVPPGVVPANFKRVQQRFATSCRAKRNSPSMG
eukprot:CAMPEP_0198536720 /NCGR_PEP_ID=MMETSP1462-20131121/43215_1 /TAXON_ID=1333877 /ORGANISM="Brandtodinium nutriculum, Strain RCC3387" /LENGTH=48 /DNA_ID= /DNA_START= /DNA_END= /DNA_ORIENTATION=